MGYELHDVIGNVGVFLIVGSYLLVQLGRMSATRLPYIVLNGLGALFILFSLYFDFNMSAFLVEVIWLLISLLGAARILLGRQRGAAGDPPAPFG
jgi:hypothetical protein